MSFSQSSTLTFEKAFRGKYTALASKIDTSHGLWNQLLDRDVLSSQQISTCQSAVTEDERVSKMLDLLRKRDDLLFPRFCDALAATGQRHVVDYLYSEIDSSPPSLPDSTSYAGSSQVSYAAQPLVAAKMEVPLYGSFRDAFRNVSSQIVDKVDVSHGLIDVLYRNGVLLESHVSDIKGCRTETDKANKLLELLQRRDDAMFPRFCEALYETGQKNIVEEILRPNLSGVRVHEAHLRPPAAAPLPVTVFSAAANVPAAVEKPASKLHRPPPDVHRPRTELPEDVNIIPYRCLHDLEMLTEGGFGIVYKAEHEDWGTVAYKELKANIIKPETRLAKDLVHEAQMHKLRHPNIVMLIAVTFELQHYGVVFEFVTYGGLDNFLENYEVEWPVKLCVAQGVIRGMNYLHTKTPAAIVHGDLKIQNVLVGEDYKAKICDFGLAKWRQYSTTKTNSRTQRGTVTHIPPENWRDINASRTTKFDVYGFGIMLWELMTENVPFTGRDGRQAPSEQIQAAVIAGQRPDIRDIQGPQHLEVFARKCVEKCWNGDPEQRPTFAELNAQFEDMLKTNDDARKEAISHLNEQTSQRPMDTD